MNKRIVQFFTLGLLLFPIVACSSKKNSTELASMTQSTTLVGSSGPTMKYNGKDVPTLRVKSFTPGFAIPDGDGGVIWIEGESPQQNSSFVDARELKLKIRELAEQLIANVNDPFLSKAIALPTSFVNLNNLNQTSTFGRLVAEQLIYEFNQRGYPVKEYRIPSTSISARSDGEFYLMRTIKNVATQGAVVIAGTYASNSNTIFLNARLIRPSDGRVLRTANMVMPNTGSTKQMLAGGKSSMSLKKGSIPIKGSKEKDVPKSTNPFDNGADVH